MYGELALARDKRDFCSGYNPPVHFRNLQSCLECARDLELPKRGTRFGRPSGIPYDNMTDIQGIRYPHPGMFYVALWVEP